MGLSLCLQQTCRESIRQSLEAKLTLALRQRQAPKLELSQYLTYQDRMVGLYEDAKERGDVRSFRRHGLAFEYARLKREEAPDLVEEMGCGFACCRFHPLREEVVQWLLFVIPDFFAPLEFPEAYVEYVAVHEHGEEITMGLHELATLLEFAIAKKEKKLTPYLNWLERHYAIKFADVFSRHAHVVLPDSENLQRIMGVYGQGEYAKHVRGFIESFAWPYRALQKLSRYAQAVQDQKG